MKVKQLKELLEKFNPELDVFVSDPDRSSITGEIIGARIITVRTEREFGINEHHSHDFPIGYKFLKLF